MTALLLAAVAGLGVGMVMAWRKNRAAGKRPIVALDRATVEEVTDLVAKRRYLKATKILRNQAGHTLIEARNRAEDWDPEQERRAAI